MTYVPSHFRYMLKELLMNSAVATINRHSKPGRQKLAGTLNAQTDALPDVRVIVAMGYEDVTIKISDQGGGISRSKADSIWTFAHSTLSEKFKVEDDGGAEPSIRGFGLPLARIYARYFGGEVRRSEDRSDEIANLSLATKPQTLVLPYNPPPSVTILTILIPHSNPFLHRIASLIAANS